jgi:primosomal protein N''
VSAPASNGSTAPHGRLPASVAAAGSSAAAWPAARRTLGRPAVTLTPTPAEQRAVRADAERRLVELRRVRDVRLPDADDAAVMSERTTIDSEIRAAEQALKAC